MRLVQGRLIDMEPILRKAAARYPGMPVWRSALAAALAEAGHEREAQLEINALAVDDFAIVPRDLLWTYNLAFLSVAAAKAGDVVRAARLYELLLPYADLNVVSTRLGVGCLGPAAHYLGLLANVLGRGDTAARHFEGAIALEARMGADALLASSRYQYARTLLARGDPKDRDAAATLLRQALVAAQELNLKQLAEQVRALG
jgi:hypothetical protein